MTRAERRGASPAAIVLTYAVIVLVAAGIVAVVVTTVRDRADDGGLRAFAADGRGAMVLLCAIYLVVVVVTGRGMIAAPNYRILDRSLRECEARMRILFDAGDTGSMPRIQARDTIAAEMDRLRRHGEVASWVPWVDWVLTIPLTKLAAGWRAFHGAERRLVHLVADDDLDEYGGNIIAELRLTVPDEADALAARLAAASTPGRKRTVIEYAQYRVGEIQELDQEVRFDLQRTALWLTSIGLLAILAVGFAFDGVRVSLLAGALGGFLAPAVATLQNRARPGSLAVAVLSPVGGALAAAGGLFLIRMLSDDRIGVLGPAFQSGGQDGTWGPVAIATALLFGFSGKLFSEIAIAASGRLTKSAS